MFKFLTVTRKITLIFKKGYFFIFAQINTIIFHVGWRLSIAIMTHIMSIYYLEQLFIVISY